MPETVHFEQPIRYVYLDHQGAYWEIGASFQRMYQIASAADLIKEGFQGIGVYLDDPSAVAVEELRSHAGLIVSSDAVLPEELKEGFIEPGRVSFLRHLGSYQNMMDSWQKLYRETTEPLRAAPGFEIYINDCALVPESDLITDLYLPIQ